VLDDVLVHLEGNRPYSGAIEWAKSFAIAGHESAENSSDTMNTDKPTIDAELESLQRESFTYFLHRTNPQNGLVCDKTAPIGPLPLPPPALLWRLMVENYRTGFVWQLMRGCPYIAGGLRRAGFTGGWL
jgi:hypothetical protein